MFAERTSCFFFLFILVVNGGTWVGCLPLKTCASLPAPPIVRGESGIYLRPICLCDLQISMLFFVE